MEEGEWGFCKLKGEEVEVEKKKTAKGKDITSSFFRRGLFERLSARFLALPRFLSLFRSSPGHRGR